MSTYLTALNKVRKASWICTKSHPLSIFHGNPFSSFCVILLTNQPTNNQTRENTTSMVEVIKRYFVILRKDQLHLSVCESVEVSIREGLSL